MSTLNDLATKFDTLKKQMMAEGQAALNVEFAKVFEAYPEVTLIKWQQYTPYFNDGDTCEFSVGDFTISNAADPDDVGSWGEYEGNTDGEWAENLWGDTKKKYPLIDELESFCMSSIGEDILLMTFGDHASVTVTREGMSSEELDHE